MSTLFKNEGAKRRPTTKIAGLMINRDLIRYREHYPSENINMPGRTSNLRFYKNQIRSVPDGDFIDEIHMKVGGVVNVLQVHAVCNQSNPPRVHETKAQLYIFVDISVVWCSNVWACVHLLICELSLPTSRVHEDMINGSGTRRSTYFEQRHVPPVVRRLPDARSAPWLCSVVISHSWGGHELPRTDFTSPRATSHDQGLIFGISFLIFVLISCNSTRFDRRTRTHTGCCCHRARQEELRADSRLLWRKRGRLADRRARAHTGICKTFH